MAFKFSKLLSNIVNSMAKPKASPPPVIATSKPKTATSKPLSAIKKATTTNGASSLAKKTTSPQPTMQRTTTNQAPLGKSNPKQSNKSVAHAELNALAKGSPLAQDVLKALQHEGKPQYLSDEKYLTRFARNGWHEEETVQVHSLMDTWIKLKLHSQNRHYILPTRTDLQPSNLASFDPNNPDPAYRQDILTAAQEVINLSQTDPNSVDSEILKAAQAAILSIEYGVDLTSSRPEDLVDNRGDWHDWDAAGIQNAYSAVTDIAQKLWQVPGIAPFAQADNPWDLFRAIMGPVQINLSSEQYYKDRATGVQNRIQSSAQTIPRFQNWNYSTLIEVYTHRLDNEDDGTPYSQNQQNLDWFKFNLVHEFGHVFNSRLTGFATNQLNQGIFVEGGAQVAYNQGWGDYQQAGFIRQNYVDMIGEEWADQFLFWVYGEFKESNNGLTLEGQARQDWMDMHIADFINRASRRTLGIEELGNEVFEDSNWSQSLQPGTINTDGTPLNVRTDPNGESTHNVFASIQDGSSVKVIGQSADGQWLAVSYNDTIIGWVSKDFVNLNSSNSNLPEYSPEQINKLNGA